MDSVLRPEGGTRRKQEVGLVTVFFGGKMNGCWPGDDIIRVSDH